VYVRNEHDIAISLRGTKVFSRRSRLCYSVASVFCLSSIVVVVVCTECIVAKRCVLEQKLLVTAYRKSYVRNRLVPK